MQMNLNLKACDKRTCAEKTDKIKVHAKTFVSTISKPRQGFLKFCVLKNKVIVTSGEIALIYFQTQTVLKVFLETKHGESIDTP